MSKRKLLLLILLLAAVLRFYKLNEVPPGVNRDEASIGYTAYSLLETGKDEYGRFLPVSFQSFGDWKLPLYIYLTVPVVWIFGLSEFSVRLLSATAGTATVLITYFLVGELFYRIQSKYPVSNIQYLSSLMLAISPWHIHLSRVESESNVAVFFVALGTLLFLKAIRGKANYLILTSILFSLTYYTYHGNHIFTTLLLSGLIAIHYKEIPKKRSTFFSILIFFALVGFILSKTLVSADKTKISGISIFGDPAVVHTEIELPRGEHEDIKSLFAKLMHNRVIYALEKVPQNYIMGFSPEFLFIRGGTNKAHNIPNFGNMYLVEAPFLLLGLFFLFKQAINRKDNDKKPYILILLWFFISPVAASITKDAPHTNRMFAIFPILPMVVAMGLVQVFNLLEPDKILLKLSIGIVFILFIFNFFVYMDRYYVHFPKTDAKYWGKKHKELTELLSTEKYKNKKVAINNPETSPYIFLLFYLQYDPELYQRTAVRYPPTEDEFVHVKSFDRFEFKQLSDPEVKFEIIEE